MTPDKIDRKTMAVKGGEAWVEIVTFEKPRFVKIEWNQRDPDGVIRHKEKQVLMNGTETGDCPECHQMPCPHTAKLLGWPT